MPDKTKINMEDKMIYVGIDVSSKTSDYTIIDQNKKVIRAVKKKNDLEGLKSIDKYLNKFDKNEIKIGLETTGIFWNPIHNFFFKNRYDISLLNAYQTSKFANLIYSKTKTDKLDSYIIAVMMNTDYYKECIVPEDSQANLKELVKSSNKLQVKLYNQKRRISTQIKKVFFEYDSLFKNIFSISSLLILKTYTDFKKIAELKPDELVRLFRGIKGNNLSIEKANVIINTAKESITSEIGLEAASFVLLQDIQLYESLVKLKDKIDEKIDLYMKEYEFTEDKNEEINSLNPINAVLSIPGVGKKTISTLIAFCGDLSNFDNLSKFKGYIGIYPQISQSGTMNYSNAHKKGIPILKKQLYLASISSIRHNMELRQIYLNALSKKKSKAQAIAKVRNKLISIIWHLYNHKITYDASKVMVNQAA